MNKVKIGQIFETSGKYGTFSPSKASIYFKRLGENLSSYFEIDSSVCIDASNFSDIVQSENKIVFDDNTAGFTGVGSMQTIQLEVLGDVAEISYPISVLTSSFYYIYFRSKIGENNSSLEIYLDGKFVNSIDSLSLSADWEWLVSSFDIESGEHLLSIKIRGNNFNLDKVYITDTETVFVGNENGEDYSVSPYLTVHSQIYELDSEFNPLSAILVYDFKNSLNNIVIDDWYNFDITYLDGSLYDVAVLYYALVITVTGSSTDNTIMWQPSDSTNALPSIIKVN